MSKPNPDLTNVTWRRAPEVADGERAIEVAFLDGGMVALRDSADPDGPALIYTPSEWTAFIAGAGAGEFDLT